MKVVFIGSDAQLAEMARLALMLRWPDVIITNATKAIPGLDLIEEEFPDLVFYHPADGDLNLRETIGALRSFSPVPLIVMSRQKRDIELELALSLGADDYVEATDSLSILMARIVAVLRRASTNNSGVGARDVLVSGELLVNPGTHEVYQGHRRLNLSKTEFDLLYRLMENSGSVVTHSRLKHVLWRDREIENNLLKKHVQRLRRKLGDDAINPRLIASVRAVGYRFVGPTPIRWDLNDLSADSLGSDGGALAVEEVQDASTLALPTPGS